VARGCIGNPWIFQQTKALAKTGVLPPPPSLFEQRKVITKHFDLAAELYGEEKTAMVMRKSCIKYSALHPKHNLVRADFTKIKSREDLHQVIRDWYSEDLDGCYLPRSIHV
jgi:tRNA-dihydrouridine synthase B